MTGMYDQYTMSEAMAYADRDISNAMHELDMSILLTEHAFLLENGIEIKYVNEDGTPNENSDSFKEKVKKFIEKVIETFKALGRKAMLHFNEIKLKIINFISGKFGNKVFNKIEKIDPRDLGNYFYNNGYNYTIQLNFNRKKINLIDSTCSIAAISDELYDICTYKYREDYKTIIDDKLEKAKKIYKEMIDSAGTAELCSGTLIGDALKLSKFSRYTRKYPDIYVLEINSRLENLNSILKSFDKSENPIDHYNMIKYAINAIEQIYRMQLIRAQKEIMDKFKVLKFILNCKGFKEYCKEKGIDLEDKKPKSTNESASPKYDGKYFIVNA